MLCPPSHLLGTALALITAASVARLEAKVGPFSVTQVSEALVRAYNREDASALHRLLAPSLRARHTVEAVRETLRLCRVLTYDIHRISTPVWGGRRQGYFAVHAEPKVFEMHLEIDDDQKIIHWVVADDLTANPQQSRISHLD